MEPHLKRRRNFCVWVTASLVVVASLGALLHYHSTLVSTLFSAAKTFTNLPSPDPPSILPSSSSIFLQIQQKEQKLRVGSSDKHLMGATCLFNSDCKTGHCFGRSVFSPFSKKCVECELDAHCGGEIDENGDAVSLPAEAPVAFCVIGSSSDDPLPFCSRWKRGQPIPRDGYPVVLGVSSDDEEGRSNVVLVPRFVRKSGLPSVVMYHVPLDQQEYGGDGGIIINATHVTFPLSTHVVAGVARSNEYATTVRAAPTYPTATTREVGVANFGFFENPRSILTDRAHVVLGEKTHVLTRHGPFLDTQTEERIRRERKQRKKKEDEDAHENRGKRDRHIVRAAAFSAVGDRLVEAAQDNVAISEQLRPYARASGGTLDVERRQLSSSWRTHSKRAREGITKLRHERTAMYSTSHCTHVERQPGLSTTSAEEENREEKGKGRGAVTLALDRNLVTLNGELTSSPFASFGLRAGVFVLHFDEKSNAIEMYLSASQRGWINVDRHDRQVEDVRDRAPSGLWVGPVDAIFFQGDNKVEELDDSSISSSSRPPFKKDGRTDVWFNHKSTVSPLLTRLFLGGDAEKHYRRASKIPIDYSRYEVMSAEEICPVRSNLI